MGLNKVSVLSIFNENIFLLILNFRRVYKAYVIDL